jgi:hypothetical protein
MKDDLLRRYARHSLADMVRGLDEHFPSEHFALPDLFLEERRRVLARVTAAVLERHEETYRAIWEEHRKLVRYLRQADAPIPDALAIVARHVLEREALAELVGVRGVGPLPERLLEALAEADTLGLTLDLTATRPAMQQLVDRALAGVDAETTPERVTTAQRLVEDARALGLPFGLWAAQNHFLATWRARPEAHAVLTPLGEALGFNLTGEPA